MAKHLRKNQAFFPISEVEPLLLQQMSKMSMIYGELEEISKINIFSEWVRNQIFGDLIKNNNLRKKQKYFTTSFWLKLFS